MSVPADLTIMGINLAKITILAYSGLPADCHGLTRDNCTFPRSQLFGCPATTLSRPNSISRLELTLLLDDGNDLVRQPTDGFTTIRFGSVAQEVTGELDGLCTFPRTVYGLSTVAM